MKKTTTTVSLILRIVVLALLAAGLIFLALSILHSKDSTYLTIALACICSGNFLNLYVINRQKVSNTDSTDEDDFSDC